MFILITTAAPNPPKRGGGGLPYLVYTALLTQSGSDPIIASTVLQNTFGTIADGGSDVSNFIIDTPLAFDLTKIYCSGFAIADSPSYFTTIPISDGGSQIKGYFDMFFYDRGGSMLSIGITFLDDSFANIKFSDLFTTRPFCLPEIRFYQ